MIDEAGRTPEYQKWKKMNPSSKPIDFIELAYRKGLIKVVKNL